MESTKQWYKSKTIWASLVTVVIGLLATFGAIDLEGEQDSIVDSIMQIVTLVSGIVALIGRVRAKSKISGNSGGSYVLILLICMTIAFGVGGCGDVNMSPQYQQAVEQAAITVGELDRRCQDGTADCNDCKMALGYASQTLDYIVDGLQGKESQ